MKERERRKREEEEEEEGEDGEEDGEGAGGVKGPWDDEEDKYLVQLVGEHGPRNWRKIADMMTNRVAKQCRERWHHHLCPGINKTPFSEEEDAAIIRLQATIGNKWADMVREIPGRTDNSIKNRWNSTLKKRVLKA